MNDKLEVNIYDQYTKLVKVIRSCKNTNQLNLCKPIVQRFEYIFRGSKARSILYYNLKKVRNKEYERLTSTTVGRPFNFIE